MKVYDISGPSPQGPADRHHQTFLLGMQFHESGIRSSMTVLDPDGIRISAYCPMVVCYAFAAELYLKSLISGSKRGHDLKNLYKDIPAPLRGEIASLYRGRTGRSPAKLLSDLETMAGAFAEWRYVFEGDGQQLRFNLLNAFVRSVFKTIRLHRSDWEVSRDREVRLLSDADEPIMTLKNFGGGTFVVAVDGTGGTLNTPDA